MHNIYKIYMEYYKYIHIKQKILICVYIYINLHNYISEPGTTIWAQRVRWGSRGIPENDQFIKSCYLIVD